MQPSDFTVHPWGSILQNTEAETIALNIMKILKRNGNTFRLLSYDEYKRERLKDGNFTDLEHHVFKKVVGFCVSVDTARLFSPDWDKIYTSNTPKYS